MLCQEILKDKGEDEGVLEVFTIFEKSSKIFMKTVDKYECIR